MAVRDYTREIIDTVSQYKPMPRKPIDWSSISNSLNGMQTNFKTQALASALESGDQEAINKARAALDPTGFADLLEQQAQRAEERKWALEDKANAFNQQKELLGMQLANSMALENMKNQNARNLAEFKAGLGIGGLNANPLDKKRIETIGKKMDENIASSQEMVDKYNRMEQLLNSPNVTTGGLKGYAQEQLNDAFLNPETVELRSLIKEIVPRMRPTGSGSTSDRDMKIFEEATVGLAKDKDANLNIVKGRKMVDENNIAKEELRYQWLSNGGGLGEFDKQWRDYLNKNPIFENKAGKLNPNRKDAYEWFYGTTTPSNATVQIKSPDGRIFEIPESEVENAIAQGGVRL